MQPRATFQIQPKKKRNLVDVKCTDCGLEYQRDASTLDSWSGRCSKCHRSYAKKRFYNARR